MTQNDHTTRSDPASDDHSDDRPAPTPDEITVRTDDEDTDTDTDTETATDKNAASLTPTPSDLSPRSQDDTPTDDTPTDDTDTTHNTTPESATPETEPETDTDPQTAEQTHPLTPDTVTARQNDDQHTDTETPDDTTHSDLPTHPVTTTTDDTPSPPASPSQSETDTRTFHFRREPKEDDTAALPQSADSLSITLSDVVTTDYGEKIIPTGDTYDILSSGGAHLADELDWNTTHATFSDEHSAWVIDNTSASVAQLTATLTDNGYDYTINHDDIAPIQTNSDTQTDEDTYDTWMDVADIVQDSDTPIPATIELYEDEPGMKYDSPSVDLMTTTQLKLLQFDTGITDDQHMISVTAPQYDNDPGWQGVGPAIMHLPDDSHNCDSFIYYSESVSTDEDPSNPHDYARRYCVPIKSITVHL